MQFRWVFVLLVWLVLGTSAQAQTSSTPNSNPFQELVKSLQSPTGLLVGACVLGYAYVSMSSGGSSNKKKIATGHWAKGTEKANARKVALKQINERRHNAVTFWMGGSPKIVPLKNPKTQGKKVVRFKIAPQNNTIFLPDVQRGVAVCGAPGSGKTFSAIDPMIRSVLRQGFPLVIYDFKYPSQTECHAQLAQELGYDVRIFAPGFKESEVCNPLDFLSGPDDGDMAAQLAKVLNKNFSLNGGKGGEDPFFQLSGDQLIKAVLQLAKTTQFADFLTCQKILALPPTELIERLEASKVSPWIKLSFEQFMSMKMSEKTSSSVAATAALLFSNFATPDILACLCGQTTIPLDLEGKQMLVFGMDRHRREVVGPLLASVLHLIVARNIGRRRKVPLPVFLDELPTIALPALANWLNEARSEGFVGVIGYQNMSQLEKAYTREGSRAILTGCNSKFFFNPGEFESAKYFADYLGDEELRYNQKSRNYSSGRGGSSSGRNISEHDKTRKLLTPEEFLKLAPGSCVLINPAYADLDEVNVPLKLKVPVPPSELAVQVKSQEGWPELQENLRSKSPQVRVSDPDIQNRIAELDRLYPAPEQEKTKPVDSQGSTPKSKKEQLAQAVLDELVNSAVDEF